MTEPVCSDLRRCLDQQWNLGHYRQTHTPRIVATIDLDQGPQPAYRCLDMAIGVDGTLHLGDVPAHLQPIIETAIDYEHANGGWRTGQHLYLTSDWGHVIAGGTLRNPGAHFDGMQSKRYQPKLEPCHAYLWSDHTPAVFYPQPFDFDSHNPDVDNLFGVTDRQKQPGRAWTSEKGQLVFATAYSIHEAVPAETSGQRRFIRIEFSAKRFDRDINTRNPAFPYDRRWRFGPRPVPDHLR